MVYELLFNISIFFLACIVLVLSGTLLVKALSHLSSYLKVSEFVVGFILMAFATSLPELFVGINASLAKTPDLIIGTIIGANILDLTIVGGMIVLLARGIKIESSKTKTDALYMFVLVTLSMILFVIGDGLSRVDGVVLLLALLLYARKLFIEQRRFHKPMDNHVTRLEPILHTALFLISIFLLYASSHFVVTYGLKISENLDFPVALIGLIFVPIGTTLPELTFESRAVLMGHTQMALGDLIGSVIVNSTLVLGVSALIFPLVSSNLVFTLISGLFMLILAFLFATFIETGDKLYVKEGISLILLYVFFVVMQVYLEGIFF